MSRTSSKFSFAVLALLTAAAISANAQASRTWVSGNGDDANPCSRSSPCRTFASAISKTAANGEINALDPYGFGPVTITKSITIDGSGSMSSILAASTTGITVNAGVDDVVIIRGLSLNGFRTAGAYRGLKFIGGKMLMIENCQFTGFGQRAISIEPTTTTSQVFINNTEIRGNLSNGVVVQPGPTSTTRVVVENSRIHDNAAFGISITSGSSVMMRNSTLAMNGMSAIRLDASTAASTLDLNSVVIHGNNVGISAGPGSSVTRISDVKIFGNATGISFDGGSVLSFGNNYITGNTIGNGPPSGTILPQ